MINLIRGGFFKGPEQIKKITWSRSVLRCKNLMVCHMVTCLNENNASADVHPNDGEQTNPSEKRTCW